MLIRYNGSIREAEILRLFDDNLRVALQGGEDAVELTWADGTWWSEDSQPVSFEFLTASEIRLLIPPAKAMHGAAY